jgi:tetratricopeptide (TPR) repeat protein
MEYEDFSLRIEPKRGDVYPVSVLRSPAGEARSSFRLPFDPEQIGDLLLALGDTVRGSSEAVKRQVSPTATRTGPQQIGDQLFSALFAGPVRSLLDRSLGMMHGRDRGLRIKLHIDPEDPSLAQLASLPWEFLYRKETRDFLNLSRFTPILRYLDVQRPYSPLPLEPPLRILVVISDPEGYPRLDLKRERSLIETSWANQEGVQVEFVERATTLALQDWLVQRPYHVLHYMGHGDFSEETGQGVLLMEDEQGQGARVDGSTLGVLLRDVPTLRLVFLNACETAKATRQQACDPFAGVAAAMVLAGIPAVVAMQFPISDRAAITFAQRFYSLLSRGEPVDASVAEGRRAIRLAQPETMEWATPVLFMRAPQGVIFHMREAPAAKVPQPEAPTLPSKVDRELEERLEQLYTEGLSAFWLEEWERACRCFQAVVDSRPDYEDASAKLDEATRQRKWSAWYLEARAAQEVGDWQGAQALLQRLVREAPEYRDAATRLPEAQKQHRLADWYAEARRMHRAQQWRAVVNIFEKIAASEPEYPDPEELLETAKVQAEEEQRRSEIGELHRQALEAMEAKQWGEARRLLRRVQKMEPGFADAKRLLARAEAELAGQKVVPEAVPMEPAKRGPPVGALVAVGALAVVAIGVVLMRGGGAPPPPPTPTVTPVATEVTPSAAELTLTALAILPVHTGTATNTPPPVTPTNTASPTPTATRRLPTAKPQPTSTNTPLPPPTSTPLPPPTDTPLPPPTNTPAPPPPTKTLPPVAPTKTLPPA